VVVNLANFKELEKRMLEKKRLLKEAQKEFPQYINKKRESDPKFPLKLNGKNPLVEEVTVSRYVTKDHEESIGGTMKVRTRNNEFNPYFGCCLSGNQYCCIVTDEKDKKMLPRNLEIFIKEFSRFFYFVFLKQKKIKIKDWHDPGWPYSRK
jgi:hypothetical protein